MTKILVTGGAGFIGSHICDFLISKNYSVRVIDNLSTGNKKNVEHLINHPNFEFIYGDITNLELLRRICKDINMICHQAAIPSVPRSVEDPLTSHDTNVNGFLNILLIAKEYGIKRIVYASSSSVYGDDPNLPKVENFIGKQLSPYAVNKYINELYAKNFTDLYNMECIGLRYFNVFGPRQDPTSQYSGVISKFITKILSHEQPTINGDGTFSRDFTYVDNAVIANYLALTTTNKECFGNTFNIGCGDRITINDLLETIKKILSSDINALHGPVRKGDIPHSHANINKTIDMLKYKVVKRFEDGMIDTINFYKHN